MVYLCEDTKIFFMQLLVGITYKKFYKGVIRVTILTQVRSQKLQLGGSF